MYLENNVCDKRYAIVTAALKARLFFTMGRISLVREIIGERPNTPKSIPHKGDNSAKNPNDIN